MRRRSGRWYTWKISALPVLLKVGECGNFRSDFQFVVCGCCVGIVAWGDTRIVFDFQNLLRKPPNRLVLDMVEFVQLFYRWLLLIHFLFLHCPYNKHHVCLMATQLLPTPSAHCSHSRTFCVMSMWKGTFTLHSLGRTHFSNNFQNIWLILSLN